MNSTLLDAFTKKPETFSASLAEEIFTLVEENKKLKETIATQNHKIECLKKFSLIRLTEPDMTRFKSIQKPNPYLLEIHQTVLGQIIRVKNKDGKWEYATDRPLC